MFCHLAANLFTNNPTPCHPSDSKSTPQIAGFNCEKCAEDRRTQQEAHHVRFESSSKSGDSSSDPGKIITEDDTDDEEEEEQEDEEEKNKRRRREEGGSPVDFLLGLQGYVAAEILEAVIRKLKTKSPQNGVENHSSVISCANIEEVFEADQELKAASSATSSARTAIVKDNNPQIALPLPPCTCVEETLQTISDSKIQTRAAVKVRDAVMASTERLVLTIVARKKNDRGGEAKVDGQKVVVTVADLEAAVKSAFSESMATLATAAGRKTMIRLAIERQFAESAVMANTGAANAGQLHVKGGEQVSKELPMRHQLIKGGQLKLRGRSKKTAREEKARAHS